VNRQGSQGILDGASNSSLENEFGTHNEEDVVKQILEKGSMQETEVHIHSLSPHLDFLTLPFPTQSSPAARDLANMISHQSSERQGNRNIVNGPTVPH
jgi:Shwachman-Bodian-Diamond syndrome (SBDS) protein